MRCQGVPGGRLCLSRAQVARGIVERRSKDMADAAAQQRKGRSFDRGVVRDRGAKDDSAPRADRWRYSDKGLIRYQMHVNTASKPADRRGKLTEPGGAISWRPVRRNEDMG